MTLAACGEGSKGASDGRPRLKPDALETAVAGPDGRPQKARVATRKGEILIMGIEGKVVAVPLGSREGQRALGVSEAQLAKVAPPAADTQAADLPDLSAQEILEADFQSQRAPALPQAEPGAAPPPPGTFLGASVAELRPGDTPQIAGKARKKQPTPARDRLRLVEVTADLKRGVDADTAFAYATCALAGWAARNGTPFARHVRTLQQDADGRLRVASVFAVSAVEPMGLRVVEARTTLAECETRGIPAA
ncbi:hypothetical protein DRW48_15435 [Paracoccus suum]|uniref:Uncharacterized protein n=2 Tax=Paracoccus suum TaxID=2259340 RepID=A0A344PND1_9RHOB|nr:hypothetical protein DRW48_15435 [Paracoccus suum]